MGRSESSEDSDHLKNFPKCFPENVLKLEDIPQNSEMKNRRTVEQMIEDSLLRHIILTFEERISVSQFAAGRDFDTAARKGGYDIKDAARRYFPDFQKMLGTWGVQLSQEIRTTRPQYLWPPQLVLEAIISSPSEDEKRQQSTHTARSENLPSSSRSTSNSKQCQREEDEALILLRLTIENRLDPRDLIHYDYVRRFASEAGYTLTDYNESHQYMHHVWKVHDYLQSVILESRPISEEYDKEFLGEVSDSDSF